MPQKAHRTSSSWATLLIRGPSIPVWFTGDLSAPGGTDACLSEPLQDDGWKNRPHSVLPPFSVNLQWKMLNTSDPLSINELVRCQGGLGTRPLDEECWLMGWWFRVSSKLHNSWTVKQLPLYCWVVNEHCLVRSFLCNLQFRNWHTQTIFLCLLQHFYLYAS